MFGPCSCSTIWDFVCEETLDSERIGEHRHGSNCALGSLRYQGLVRRGVLRSPRVGAALSSGGRKEMMTRRALAGSTRSSLLTGTDVGIKMAGGYIVRRCSTDKV